MDENLTKKLKKKSVDLGASLVGIADASLYDEAPENHRPNDILKDATCVISIGIAMPKAVLQQSLPTLYTRSIITVGEFINQIALQLGIWLENEGFDAIPITSRGPLYMEALSGKILGDLSHKHTAVLAGLGEMGINTLLLNPKYGTRLMLGSVVTNAPAIPDAPFQGSVCLGSKCLKCVTSCPIKAISPSGVVDKARCARYYRQFQEIFFETWGIYPCRECRKVCSKVVERDERQLKLPADDN
jgi:epoxyqueuosine reductase